MQHPVTKSIRLIAPVLAVLAVWPTSVAFADGPPIVTTNAATAITDTTAQLNGYVDANGKDATVTFDYGTTTAYGMTSGHAGRQGRQGAFVYHAVTGLTPGTVYHVRLRATNSKGTTVGADQHVHDRPAPRQPLRLPRPPPPRPRSPARPRRRF